MRDLKDVRFAYAPRQHLVGVDEQAHGIFRETLRKLKDAGAELVEVDLGGDFLALANGVTWPIFFHDTMPAIREFLATNEVPVSFEEIFAALGEHIQEGWSRSVVPFGPGLHLRTRSYRVALNARHELRRRLVSNARSNGRMRCSSRRRPVRRLGSTINGTSMLRARSVTDVFLSRNTHPSNSVGVPGISLPMAVNAEGLPLGLELDAAAGRDRDLLALARRVERHPRTRAPTAGHLARLGLFNRCPKVTEDIMNDAINAGRRRFLGAAGMTIAAAGFGAVEAERRSPSQARSFGASKQIDAGVLNIGYAELGPTRRLLRWFFCHGWPYDIHSYVDVAPLLASAGYRVIVPYLRGYGTTQLSVERDVPKRPAVGGRRRHRRA